MLTRKPGDLLVSDRVNICAVMTAFRQGGWGRSFWWGDIWSDLEGEESAMSQPCEKLRKGYFGREISSTQSESGKDLACLRT